MEPDKHNADPRFYLANERTFLAWIRTSIAIMAFGFVVVKFALFIQQLSLLSGKEIHRSDQGYSNFIGIVIVISGAIILLFSFLKYKRTNKELAEGRYRSTSRLITLLTLIILVVAIMLIIYLISYSG